MTLETKQVYRSYHLKQNKYTGQVIGNKTSSFRRKINSQFQLLILLICHLAYKYLKLIRWWAFQIEKGK